MLYTKIMIMIAVYMVSVLCIFAINKKNDKSISAKKYFLSVLIILAFILLEEALTWLFQMTCSLFAGKSFASNDTTVIVVFEVLIKVSSLFISFVTMIIIFKLIAECSMPQNMWYVLAVCIAISIVNAVRSGIYSASMLSMLSDINIFYADYWLYMSAITAKLQVLNNVYMIIRCILVLLATWSVGNKLLKTDDEMVEGI